MRHRCHFQLRRKSRADRMMAKLREIKEALRKRMHEPIPEVGKWLGQSLPDISPIMPCRPTAQRYMRFATMSLYSVTGNYAGAARGRTWCGTRMAKLAMNFSQSPVSFIPGQVGGLPSNTQGRSRVRVFRSLGSVRGDRGNSVPYRDQSDSSPTLQWLCPNLTMNRSAGITPSSACASPGTRPGPRGHPAC